MTLKTMAIDGNQWDIIQGTSIQNKIILNMNNFFVIESNSSLISNGDTTHDGSKMHDDVTIVRMIIAEGSNYV